MRAAHYFNIIGAVRQIGVFVYFGWDGEAGERSIIKHFIIIIIPSHCLIRRFIERFLHVSAAVDQLYSIIEGVAAIVVVIDNVVEADAGEVLFRIVAGERLARCRSVVAAEAEPF